MSRLILSEDATIELDGKKVTLKEGDSVQVNRSIFKVDNEFEINTEKGRMLIEPGDQIQVGGQYKALSPSEFTSDGKMFSIEKGDEFDVITPKTESTSKTENVIEEGVWDEVKRGFLGKDTAAEAVAQILGKLLKLGRLIVAKAERAKENGQYPYDELLRSEEMKTLNELYKLNKEGLGGERVSVGEVVDILDLEDPTELINRIRDELVRIGDKRLARRVEEMIPRGIFGKINQVWKNITGAKMAKGDLTQTKAESQGKTEDSNLDKAIESAKGRQPSDQDKAQKILSVIKKIGRVDIPKIIEYFGGKVDEKDIKQAIRSRKKSKPRKSAKASFARKVDKATEEVLGKKPPRVKGPKKRISPAPRKEKAKLEKANPPKKEKTRVAK